MIRGCQESSRSEWPVRTCGITWKLAFGDRPLRSFYFESEEFACPDDNDVTWFLRISSCTSTKNREEVYLNFRSKTAGNEDPYKDGICYLETHSFDEKPLPMSTEMATSTLLSSFRASIDPQKKFTLRKKSGQYVGGFGASKGSQIVVRVEVFYIDEREKLQQIGSVSQSMLLSALSKDMESAMLGVDDRTADVVLVDKARKEWRVHKFILMARSPVFAAMFRTDMVENKSGRVHLKDVSGDVLSRLIRYMYTGDVDRGTLGVDLMALAHRYELGLLKDLCEETLARTLSVSNVLNALVIANLYDARELRDAALKFIRTNIQAVKGSPAWSSVQPNELRQILDVML